MTKLTLVNDEQAKQIRTEVSEWYSNSSGALMFSDCGSSSRSAIMEFLANRVGLTMYKCVANMENNAEKSENGVD